jgi:penicillin-binding protein 2
MKRLDKIKSQSNSLFRNRATQVALVFFLLFAALAVRLGYLQLYQGEVLRERSETNSIRIRKIHAPRGIIKDRHGQVLVHNAPAFRAVYVPNPSSSLSRTREDFISLYRKHNLEIPREIQTISNTPRFVSVRLDSALTQEKLALIETKAHLLPGVLVETQPIRKYPYGEMLAHTLGYIGEISQAELTRDVSGHYSSGDLVGKTGLEKSMESLLRGRDGAEYTEVNAVGKELNTIAKLTPRGGNDLILTIDLSLQEAVWQALGGKPGAVVAINPMNGEILAMASSPSYDPNLFSQGIPSSLWRPLAADPLAPLKNRVIAGLYPPASTYKVVVAAAALEEGLIAPETSFNCAGEIQVGDKKFRCWRREGHGRVDLHRAMVESCDVYFYHVGRMLGVDTIAKYAAKFGLGEKTTIELPQERQGLVPTRRWKKERIGSAWQVGDTISAAIGQGYNTATLLQLANAFALIANGGRRYQPRLIKRLVAPGGTVLEETTPQVIGEFPMQKRTLDILRRSLWGAVNEPGATAPALRRPGQDVAGKTGTAQVVRMAREGESLQFRVSGRRLKDHALFVGYAPHDRPEILVAVILEHAGAGGGAAAAPVVRKIMDAYFASAGQKTREVSAAAPAAALAGTAAPRRRE